MRLKETQQQNGIEWNERENRIKENRLNKNRERKKKKEV